MLHSSTENFVLVLFFMWQDPIAKLPVDIVDRGFDLYNVVLNYCIDLICWDKTDELPDYLDVS